MTMVKINNHICISHIVAVSKNNVIGINNQLPWHLPADMSYFKEKTKGHVVIMGRKNYEAEGKVLPDRINIIITRDKNFIAENCIVVHSVEEALVCAKKLEKKEIFIIGGGEIYKQTISLVNRIYITIIEVEIKGEVFYPQINLNQWILKSKTFYKKDKQNIYNHTYYIYDRI